MEKHDGEGGNHYKKNGKVEVIELMEMVAINILNDTEDITDDDIKKAVNASYAMKHLARTGTKDIASIDSELLKAENYLHRARNGEWIKK